MYPNLLAEMTRSNITKQDLANCLDVSLATIYKKFMHRKFTYDEGKAIRDKFFPGRSMEYIMSQTAEVVV